MKAPISWLKEFVEIEIAIPELAHLLTMAGLEVEEIRCIGLFLPKEGHHETPVSGIAWDREKIVVGSIPEVMPHPNADRLVLCKLDDGQQEHIVLTGAPNLFEFKDKGPLPRPLKVAYAKEGAQIYDGHQPGRALMTLKRAKIRGVDSYSMACSEKELGISDDHEGIIILDDDAPVGMPLADYMGDAVLEVNILPSFARCASILGLAREVAAITGKSLKSSVNSDQSSVIGDFAEIDITDPQLNPRFVLGLVRDVDIRPSPYKVQLRLKLAGMRPINNIVDATNYAMLELGEPLHAFDYDVLARRASTSLAPSHRSGKGSARRKEEVKVKIITRTAKRGEKLTTLDGIQRTLDETTVLVCDSAGALSIAGVMGGAESEVSAATRSVLLEGAAWNFINIRKTARAQDLPSEASYRFSRGVHPAIAERGVRRGLALMQTWAGGEIADGLVDNYPLPPKAPHIEITPADVRRWLGIELTIVEIQKILESLEFCCSPITDYPSPSLTGLSARAGRAGSLLVTAPDHRLDIGEGISGKADVIEEIARIYGYENIPETRMSDQLPPQIGNPVFEKEERIRDLLVIQGLQEIINYRFTTPEREARCLPTADETVPHPEQAYVRLANPISPDKAFLRQSVLASLLETAERNARLRDRLGLFEIGPAFFADREGSLPGELQRLAIVLAGPRAGRGWQEADTTTMDFYDLKGILTALLDGLHIPEILYEAASQPTYHPGKCARVLGGGRELGVFGELHPLVRRNYHWPAAYSGISILAADLDLDTLLELIPPIFETAPVPEFPPVLEDLALVVDEALPAGRVAEVIRAAAGKIVAEVRLFDVYRGENIPAGKKSLAYSLTYQAPDKTLNDKDVAGIRARIVKRLEQELGAALRS